MNKRIVALGVTAVMALGAGTAVAGADQDLSTNQANLANQENVQVANVWQKTWQDDPTAVAKADASAASINIAGGDSKFALGSSNGKVFSFTKGGYADADAENVNIGKQDVEQKNYQDIDQDNKAYEVKVAVDDVNIKVILGFLGIPN